MQAQDEDRRIQWTEQVTADGDVYLKECASCGGQFPSFRAICSECEDVADLDGYRDGKKVVSDRAIGREEVSRSSSERGSV